MLSINPPVFAHRGAKQYAPENTLAAFAKAHELGVRWVEFDVMLSKDQEVVVIHDETLERTTTGRGYVHERTFSELRTFDAGSWFNPSFQGEKIPTFVEVIHFLKKNNMGANIEIKAFPGAEEITTEKVMQVIAREWTSDMLQPLISSFSEVALQVARNISATCALGFLMDHWIADWQLRAKNLKCTSIHLNQALANSYRVQEIKSLGYLVFCYTVNDRMRAEELFAMGVDALFSDWPDEILHSL